LTRIKKLTLIIRALPLRLTKIKLRKGRTVRQMAKFGRSFANWLADTARFVTCASNDKPFPWQQWPDAG
jgi:4-alpha-glucanotransferase